MIHFLDDLAYNDPGGDMPTRPKGDLASLLGNKRKHSNKLCRVELHKYLIKSLLCAEVVNPPSFARDGFYTDLDQISPVNAVRICPRYSQKLREVAKLLQNYSTFQNRNLSTKRTNYKFIAYEFYCCLLLAGCSPYKRLDG